MSKKGEAKSASAASKSTTEKAALTKASTASKQKQNGGKVMEHNIFRPRVPDGGDDESKVSRGETICPAGVGSSTEARWWCSHLANASGAATALFSFRHFL